MESPPTPPRPPVNSHGNKTSSFFNGSNVSEGFRKKQRQGRLFPPITSAKTSNATTLSKSTPNLATKAHQLTVPSVTTTTAPVDDAYVWAEVKNRERTLLRYPSHERLETLSASSRCSSRSLSPVDHRLREELILTGKAPSTPASSTPVPATPILKVTRQQSFTKEKVIVGVRLRPVIAEDHRNIGADADAKKIVVSMASDGDTATIQVQSKSGSIHFDFDHGFSGMYDDGTSKSNSGQRDVYVKLAQPLVRSLIAGVNCSFFAYGQTGTGKTFSTLGTNNDPGVVPRFCEELFQNFESGADRTWNLELSYFEIYNENIIDLLSPTRNAKKKLRVREHPEEGPFVENLASIPVTSYADIEKWLQVGNAARHQASTVRNDGSSRSHAVFSLKLVQMTTVDGRPFVRKSKANFVDLAGSERLDATSSSMSNADRMAETKNINKSLTHLGTVILQLANGKRTHISYRDSVLTWLLKDSLGGNAKTVMLATIAPSFAYAEETLSTLRYAANAYKIYNKTYVNEDPAIGLLERNEELRMENEALRAQLANRENGTNGIASDDRRVATLESIIEKLTLEIDQKDMERDRELQEKDMEIERLKEAYGISNKDKEYRSVAVDASKDNLILELKLLWELSSKPALIQLSPDSSFSEANIHVINSLSSFVGRSPNCSIHLPDAATILDVQCSINWCDGRLFLYPSADACIYVNGCRLLCGPTDVKELFDGDRLGLGVNGEYFFSVSIPIAQMESMSIVNLDKMKSEYWHARAEFWEQNYYGLREEAIARIREERQRSKETLAEMTAECKRLFGNARAMVRSFTDKYDDGKK